MNRQLKKAQELLKSTEKRLLLVSHIENEAIRFSVAKYYPASKRLAAK